MERSVSLALFPLDERCPGNRGRSSLFFVFFFVFFYYLKIFCLARLRHSNTAKKSHSLITEIHEETKGGL